MGSIDIPPFMRDKMKEKIQSDNSDVPPFMQNKTEGNGNSVKKKEPTSEDLYSGKRPSSYPLQKQKSFFAPQLNLEENKPKVQGSGDQQQEPSFNPIEFLKKDADSTGHKVNPDFDIGMQLADYHAKRNTQLNNQKSILKDQLLEDYNAKNVQQGDIAQGIAKPIVKPLIPEEKQTESDVIHGKLNGIDDYQNKLNTSIKHAASIYAADKSNDPVIVGRTVRTIMGDKNAVKEQEYANKSLPISPSDQYYNAREGMDALLTGLDAKYPDKTDPVYLSKKAELENESNNLINKYPEFKRQQVSKAIAQEIMKLHPGFSGGASQLPYTKEAIEKLGLSKEDVKDIDFDNLPIQSPLSSAIGEIYNTTLKIGAGISRAGGGLLGIDPDFLSAYNQQALQRGQQRFEDVSGLENTPTVVDTKKGSPTYLQDIANPDKGKYNYNFHTISNAIGSGIGNLVGIVAGTKGFGSIGKSVLPSMTEATAADVGMAATMIGQGYEPYYQQSKNIIGDAPQDEWKRHLYALLNGSLDYAVFKPLGQLQEIISPSASKELGAILKDAPSLEEVSKKQLTNWVTKVLEGAKNASGETLKIGGAQVLGDVSKNIVDNLVGSKEGIKESNKQLGENILSGITNLPFSMLIPLGLGELVKGVKSSYVFKENLYNAGLDPETYLAQANDLLHKGVITQEQYNKRAQVINTANTVVNNIPDDLELNHNQRVAYTNSKLRELALDAKLNNIGDVALEDHYKKKMQEEQNARKNIIEGGEKENQYLQTKPEPDKTQPLIQAYRDKTGITKEAVSDDILLKNIAEQAQNISGGEVNKTGDEKTLYDNTVKNIGSKELVDAAISKYPAKDLLNKQYTQPEPVSGEDLKGKKIYADFNSTIADKDNKLLPFGEEIKQRINNGEPITIVTKSKDAEGQPEGANKKRMIDALGLKEQPDNLKIIEGATPEEKATLAKDGVLIDNSSSVKEASDNSGTEFINANKYNNAAKGEPEQISKPIELSVGDKKEWDSLPLSEKLKLAKENLPDVSDLSNTEIAKIADTRAKELLDKLHENDNPKQEQKNEVPVTKEKTGVANEGTDKVEPKAEKTKEPKSEEPLTDETVGKSGEQKTEPKKSVSGKKAGKYEAKAKEIADKIKKAELPSWLISSDPTISKAGIGADDLKKYLADATILVGKALDRGAEFADAIKEGAQNLVDDYIKGLGAKKLNPEFEKQLREGFEQHYKDNVGEPPSLPKEGEPKTEPEDESLTSIRKAKQMEIKAVADAYRDQKRKGWAETLRNGLEKIAKANPTKNLYDSAVSTLSNLRNDNYSDLTRDEAVATMLYLKHETGARRSELAKDINSDDANVRRAALLQDDPLKDIYENASLMAKNITTEAGRTLVFTQADMFDDEHGLQLRRMDLIRAGGGEKLSPEDEKWTAEKWEQEKELMQKIQEAKEASLKENFDKKIAALQKEYEAKLKKGAKITDKNIREKTLKQKGNDLADKILKAQIKTDKNTLQSNILGLPIAAYNALIKGVAESVRAGATIAEAIKEVIDSKKYPDLKEEDLTNHLIEIANKKTPEETLQKIKDYVKEGGETDVTKEMVGKNLIKDYVESHIGEVDQKDILDKAAKDLKEVLPDIDKKKLVEAYLKEGDYKQPTKKDLEGGIAEQKKQLQSIAKLQEDISDLEGYKKTRQRSFATEREKSDYEKQLADEKAAIIKSNKERRDKIIEDNRRIEAERNRQQKIVNDLKDKKAKLEQGIIEKKEKAERSADTPEIEGLRKAVKDLEKDIREAEAAKKAAEKKIERDRNSGIKRDNKMVEIERNRQLQKIQDLADKKEKLEKGIRDKKEKTPAKPDTPEIENLKKQVAEVDKQLREGENRAKEIDRKAQALKDKRAELDANIKRAEAGQDIINTFRNKPEKEVDAEIEAKTRQLKRAVNDNMPEDKVQQNLLKKAKENAIRKTKEFQRRIDEGDYEEPEPKTLNNKDAELIKLEKDLSKVEGQFRAKQDELRQKNKGNVELVAELGRSIYVAWLLHKFLTLGKVAAASIVRPLVEGGTRMTFGTIFDHIFPGISKSAKMGGESSSWQASKLGYEAWFKQRGQRAIENKALKVEQAFKKANDEYNTYKKLSENPNEETDPKHLEELKKERDLRLKASFGNLAYQFIGGSSIKDALQAFIHRSNEIERQFGKVSSEGIQGKNELKQNDSGGTIFKKLKSQVVEGGLDLFTNYKKDEPKGKQFFIKLINDGDYLLGFIGRSHSAVKTFSGRYSFASGFMARIEGAVDRNIRLTPDKVLEFGHESYLDWERGKYQNPNNLSDWWSHTVNQMDKDPRFQTVGKIGKQAFKTEVAIQRVPVNILWEEVTQYAAGLGKVAGLFGGKASIPKLYKGVKSELKDEGLFTNTPEFKEALKERLSNLDPYQAALIYSCFRKGSLGMGIYATAAILGGIHYGIFPHMGQKKKKEEAELAPDELNPGQIMIGNTKLGENMSALISHTQFLWPTFMGLGIAQAYHDNVKKGEMSLQAAADATYLHLNIIIGNIPQFAPVQMLKGRSIDPFVEKKIIKPMLGEKHQGFTKEDEKSSTLKYYWDKGIEFTPFNPSKIDIPNKGKLSDLPEEKWKEYNDQYKETLKTELDNLKAKTYYVTKDGKVHTDKPDYHTDYDVKVLSQLTIAQLKNLIKPIEAKSTIAAKEKIENE